MSRTAVADDATSHKTVKGIYLGCRKCQHGGHQVSLSPLPVWTSSKLTDRINSNACECTIVSPLPSQTEHQETDADETPKVDAQSVPRRSSLPLSNVGSDSFDKPRTSGEIFITMGSSSGSGGGVKVSDGGHMKVYNACASGCGCRCRVIHGWTGREEHDEL